MLCLLIWRSKSKRLRSKQSIALKPKRTKTNDHSYIPYTSQQQAVEYYSLKPATKKHMEEYLRKIKDIAVDLPKKQSHENALLKSSNNLRIEEERREEVRIRIRKDISKQNDFLAGILAKKIPSMIKSPSVKSIINDSNRVSSGSLINSAQEQGGGNWESLKKEKNMRRERIIESLSTVKIAKETDIKKRYDGEIIKYEKKIDESIKASKDKKGDIIAIKMLERLKNKKEADLKTLKEDVEKMKKTHMDELTKWFAEESVKVRGKGGLISSESVAHLGLPTIPEYKPPTNCNIQASHTVKYSPPVKNTKPAFKPNKTLHL